MVVALAPDGGYPPPRQATAMATTTSSGAKGSTAKPGSGSGSPARKPAGTGAAGAAPGPTASQTAAWDAAVIGVEGALGVHAQECPLI